MIVVINSSDLIRVNMRSLYIYIYIYIYVCMYLFIYSGVIVGNFKIVYLI